MKTINKAFWDKIAREGGVYDTRKYRYIIKSPETVERIEISKLDTTAVYEAGAFVAMRVSN